MKSKTRGKLDDLFGSVGLGFPMTKYQLMSFDKLHQDYIPKISEDVINAKDILKQIREENTPVTNVDYHKRLVLAAEITYQLHTEYKFGHVKLQKLMYLCQNTTSMSLHVNFLKQAMGPYDPKMMRSIDKKFEEKKWFLFKKGDFPQYKALDNVGSHKQWYLRYFETEKDEIDLLIKVFRKAKSDLVELVVTIFQCVLDAKNQRKIISENLVKESVYAWSKHKAKFSEDQIVKTFYWMQEKGIYPSK